MQPPEDAAESRPAPLVLVAEDHADSRDALRTLLDAFGYRVLEASNGREAVDLVLSERPDVVILDMMMPVVDGFQAARELRAHPELRDLPILALTAVEGVRARVLEAGVDELLAKPLDVRVLLERVSYWIARREAAG